jgi:hypothetical protein
VAKVAAYKDEAVKVKLLWSLNAGQDLREAADTIGYPLRTVQGWIERDEGLRGEVETALEAGKVARTNAPVARDEKTGADRWKKLREDAAKLAPGMLGFLLAVDARTSTKKHGHAFSPWWRWALGNWYESGKAVFLGRIGRGGGKSTTQTNVVLAETIFGERSIPDGETWIWPFLSLDMDEANLKVGPFESALEAIGIGKADYVKHARTGGRTSIAFKDSRDNSIEVRVYPNTVSAMSGPTLVGATNDEEAKWKASTDASSGVKTNTAEEVLDAQGQCFRGDATHKKHMRISSAWMTHGPHYEDIEAGDNELHYIARIGPFLQLALDGFELVASKLEKLGKHDGAKTIRGYAATLTEDSPNVPSWVANPSHDVWGGFLRARQRVRKWLRENGSWSSDGADEGDYFEPETIDRGAIVARVITREVDGRFAAIDTGAKKNPSALGIVERVIHEVRLGTSTRERRYQFRPLVLKQWSRKPGGLPLDLRNVVLPAMARLILENQCIPAWWTDGWASDQIEHVARSFGLQTIYVSTSTATRDVYEPLDAALAHDPCPIVLAGCAGIEQAVAQLRQVRRASDGKAVVPHQGTEHGELGQVLARALAHAGVGASPPDDDAPEWRSFGSDRDEGSAYESRRE